MRTLHAILSVLPVGLVLFAGCKPLPASLDDQGSETGGTDGFGTEESGGETSTMGDESQGFEGSMGTEGETTEGTESGTTEGTGAPWGEDGDGDGESDTNEEGVSEESGMDTGAVPEPISCPPDYEKHVIDVEIPARFHAVGDIDGDGWIDMVAVGGAGVEWADIVVLMGEGPATFSPTYLGFDIQSQDIDLGDLDGDGDLELVIPNYEGGFTIYRWMGEGFDAGTFFSVEAPYIEHIELGDLDGDGDLDVLLAWQDRIQPLLHMGEGVFLAGEALQARSHAHEPALGDFDGDGKLDIVTAHGEVWMGVGDGTFEKSAGFLTLGYADYAAVGDVDGDDNLDAVVNNREEGTVTVALGDGLGGFPETLVLDGGSQPMPVVAFDLDGDQVDDVVTSNRLDGTLTLYCDLEESWQTIEILDTPFQEYLTYSLAHADFDGDGIDELVTANTSDASLTIFSASF